MHEEWEDYDRKQFLACWAANSASQIKEIACNALVQPGRKCCKLLLDEKDMEVKICRMKPSHAKPTTVLNICLSVCAAEINTFSFLSGLLFAIFFLIYLMSVTECNFPPSLLSSCYQHICFQAFLLLDTVGCTVGEELNERQSYLKRQEIKKCMQFVETYCTWRNAVFLQLNADYTTPLCSSGEVTGRWHIKMETSVMCPCSQ